MAVNDIRSNLKQEVFINEVISGVGGLTQSIDTGDFEKGLMVTSMASDLDIASVNMVLEDSDNPTSGFSSVSGEKLIGSNSDLTLTSDSAAGATLGTLGAISTKRYMRVSYATSAPPTTTRLTVFATLKAEEVPVL